MKPLKIKASFTVDETMLFQAKELAEAEDRSLSQIVNFALHDYIKRNAPISREQIAPQAKNKPTPL